MCVCVCYVPKRKYIEHYRELLSYRRFWKGISIQKKITLLYEPMDFTPVRSSNLLLERKVGLFDSLLEWYFKEK